MHIFPTPERTVLCEILRHAAQADEHDLTAGQARLAGQLYAVDCSGVFKNAAAVRVPCIPGREDIFAFPKDFRH